MVRPIPLAEVRPAGLEDADAIASVYVSTWKTTYRGLLPDDFLDSLNVDEYAERWRRTLRDDTSRVYVAATDSGVAGFASGGRERAGEDGFAGELYAIYVRDDAQGRGHGRALVHAVAGGLGRMGLGDMIVWVLRDNARARRFYERLGGVYIRAQPITIGSSVLQEVSYGWRPLDSLTY